MRRTLGLAPLTAAIFFCVSGGPFGLEPVVQAGPGVALLLILFVPLIWAVPAALMTAELASAMPTEGGYIVWVREAMGPFAGFLCGWWTWVYTWVDVAIYPVLFVAYLEQLAQLVGFGEDRFSLPSFRYLLCLLVIAVFGGINLLGARLVGRTAMVLGVALLLPFAVLVALGFSRATHTPVGVPLVAGGENLGSAVSLGLYTVMWNYLGWDSLSTISEEVEHPAQTFPRALALAMPLIVLAYLLPTWVGIAYLPDPAAWQEGSWTEVGLRVGGTALAISITVAGLVSSAGLFMATMLGASRIPFVLAREGYLPAWIARIDPRWGTPVNAILVSLLLDAIFCLQSFESLVVIDVLVYAAAILLEFAALAVLRWRQPARPRPYLIPGGWLGVSLVVIPPAALVAFGVWTSVFHDEEYGSRALPLALGALATGPIWYFLVRRFPARLVE